MSMQVVQDYLESSRPRWLPSRKSEDQLALERKSNAQKLARAATESISDRKMRAVAKVDVYNHLLPILEQHYSNQRTLHHRYRKVLAGTCGALALAVLAAGLLGYGLL